MNTNAETHEDQLVNELVEAVKTSICHQDAWVEPSGYPNAVSLAVIDNIYSLRARYGAAINVVNNFVKVSATQPGGVPRDSLSGLLDVINAHGGAEKAAESLFGNRSKSGGTGRLKSEVVHDVAHALRNTIIGGVSIDTAEQFREALETSPEAVKRAWLGVKGCGIVSWNYMQMNLGIQTAKLDRHVDGFLSRVWKHSTPPHDPDTRVALLAKAATRLGTSTRVLDHNIWRHYVRTCDCSASQEL